MSDTNKTDNKKGIFAPVLNSVAFKVFDFLVGFLIFSYSMFLICSNGYSAGRVLVMLCGIAWMGVSYTNRNSSIDNKIKNKISKCQ